MTKHDLRFVLTLFEHSDIFVCPISESMPKSLALQQKYASLFHIKTSKTGLQRPAARYDGIGKIGGGYGFLVSMVSRVVSRCPWLPSWGPW